jgi:glyoxylate reductase
VARVFVTRKLPGTALDRLAAEHEVEVWRERLPPRPGDLRARMPDVEGLLTILTDRIHRELLEAAPNLRAISNYAVGVDNIDVEAVTERGIPIGNTPDVLTEATADMTLALMLAVARRLPEAEALVRRGDWLTWEPTLLLGRDLHDSTVGIIGMGRIGRAVARRVEGFGARVLHMSTSGGVLIEQLLEQSDFVTIHCPLTEQTRGLIDDEALELMKPTGYLINTARGEIVDTQALIRALNARKIAGAGLDVTDPEPLTGGHVLLSAPNLLVVPHIGSATHSAREAMADMAVDNLLAGLRGERMRHCVNPQVYAAE